MSVSTISSRSCFVLLLSDKEMFSFRYMQWGAIQWERGIAASASLARSMDGAVITVMYILLNVT